MIPSMNWKGLLVMGLIVIVAVWIVVPLINKGLSSGTSTATAS